MPRSKADSVVAIDGAQTVSSQSPEAARSLVMDLAGSAATMTSSATLMTLATTQRSSRSLPAVLNSLRTSEFGHNNYTQAGSTEDLDTLGGEGREGVVRQCDGSDSSTGVASRHDARERAGASEKERVLLLTPTTSKSCIHAALTALDNVQSLLDPYLPTDAQEALMHWTTHHTHPKTHTTSSTSTAATTSTVLANHPFHRTTSASAPSSLTPSLQYSAPRTDDTSAAPAASTRAESPSIGVARPLRRAARTSPTAATTLGVVAAGDHGLATVTRHDALSAALYPTPSNSDHESGFVHGGQARVDSMNHGSSPHSSTTAAMATGMPNTLPPRSLFRRSDQSSPTAAATVRRHRPSHAPLLMAETGPTTTALVSTLEQPASASATTATRGTTHIGRVSGHSVLAPALAMSALNCECSTAQRSSSLMLPTPNASTAPASPAFGKPSQSQLVQRASSLERLSAHSNDEAPVPGRRASATTVVYDTSVTSPRSISMQAGPSSAELELATPSIGGGARVRQQDDRPPFSLPPPPLATARGPLAIPTHDRLHADKKANGVAKKRQEDDVLDCAPSPLFNATVAPTAPQGPRPTNLNDEEEEEAEESAKGSADGPSVASPALTNARDDDRPPPLRPHDRSGVAPTSVTAHRPSADGVATVHTPVSASLPTMYDARSTRPPFPVRRGSAQATTPSPYLVSHRIGSFSLRSGAHKNRQTDSLVEPSLIFSDSVSGGRYRFSSMNSGGSGGSTLVGERLHRRAPIGLPAWQVLEYATPLATTWPLHASAGHLSSPNALITAQRVVDAVDETEIKGVTPPTATTPQREDQNKDDTNADEPKDDAQRAFHSTAANTTTQQTSHGHPDSANHETASQRTCAPAKADVGATSTGPAEVSARGGGGDARENSTRASQSRSCSGTLHGTLHTTTNHTTSTTSNDPTRHPPPNVLENTLSSEPHTRSSLTPNTLVTTSFPIAAHTYSSFATSRSAQSGQGDQIGYPAIEPHTFGLDTLPPLPSAPHPPLRLHGTEDAAPVHTSAADGDADDEHNANANDHTDSDHSDDSGGTNTSLASSSAPHPARATPSPSVGAVPSVLLDVRSLYTPAFRAYQRQRQRASIGGHLNTLVSRVEAMARLSNSTLRGASRDDHITEQHRTGAEDEARRRAPLLLDWARHYLRDARLHAGSVLTQAMYQFQRDVSGDGRQHVSDDDETASGSEESTHSTRRSSDSDGSSNRSCISGSGLCDDAQHKKPYSALLKIRVPTGSVLSEDAATTNRDATALGPARSMPSSPLIHLFDPARASSPIQVPANTSVDTTTAVDAASSLPIGAFESGTRHRHHASASSTSLSSQQPLIGESVSGAMATWMMPGVSSVPSFSLRWSGASSPFTHSTVIGGVGVGAGVSAQPLHPRPLRYQAAVGTSGDAFVSAALLAPTSTTTHHNTIHANSNHSSNSATATTTTALSTGISPLRPVPPLVNHTNGTYNNKINTDGSGGLLVHRIGAADNNGGGGVDADVLHNSGVYQLPQSLRAAAASGGQAPAPAPSGNALRSIAGGTGEPHHLHGLLDVSTAGGVPRHGTPTTNAASTPSTTSALMHPVKDTNSVYAGDWLPLTTHLTAASVAPTSPKTPPSDTSSAGPAHGMPLVVPGLPLALQPAHVYASQLPSALSGGHHAYSHSSSSSGVWAVAGSGVEAERSTVLTPRRAPSSKPPLSPVQTPRDSPNMSPTDHSPRQTSRFRRGHGYNTAQLPPTANAVNSNGGGGGAVSTQQSPRSHWATQGRAAQADRSHADEDGNHHVSDADDGEHEVVSQELAPLLKLPPATTTTTTSASSPSKQRTEQADVNSADLASARLVHQKGEHEPLESLTASSSASSSSSSRASPTGSHLAHSSTHDDDCDALFRVWCVKPRWPTEFAPLLPLPFNATGQQVSQVDLSIAPPLSAAHVDGTSTAPTHTTPITTTQPTADARKSSAAMEEEQTVKVSRASQTQLTPSRSPLTAKNSQTQPAADGKATRVNTVTAAEDTDAYRSSPHAVPRLVPSSTTDIDTCVNAVPNTATVPRTRAPSDDKNMSDGLPPRAGERHDLPHTEADDWNRAVLLPSVPTQSSPHTTNPEWTSTTGASTHDGDYSQVSSRTSARPLPAEEEEENTDEEGVDDGEAATAKAPERVASDVPYRASDAHVSFSSSPSVNATEVDPQPRLTRTPSYPWSPTSPHSRAGSSLLVLGLIEPSSSFCSLLTSQKKESAPATAAAAGTPTSAPIAAATAPGTAHGTESETISVKPLALLPPHTLHQHLQPLPPHPFQTLTTCPGQTLAKSETSSSSSRVTSATNTSSSTPVPPLPLREAVNRRNGTHSGRHNSPTADSIKEDSGLDKDDNTHAADSDGIDSHLDDTFPDAHATGAEAHDSVAVAEEVSGEYDALEKADETSYHNVGNGGEEDGTDDEIITVISQMEPRQTLTSGPSFSLRSITGHRFSSTRITTMSPPRQEEYGMYVRVSGSGAASKLTATGKSGLIPFVVRVPDSSLSPPPHPASDAPPSALPAGDPPPATSDESTPRHHACSDIFVSRQSTECDLMSGGGQASEEGDDSCREVAATAMSADAVACSRQIDASTATPTAACDVTRTAMPLPEYALASAHVSSSSPRSVGLLENEAGSAGAAHVLPSSLTTNTTTTGASTSSTAAAAHTSGMASADPPTSTHAKTLHSPVASTASTTISTLTGHTAANTPAAHSLFLGSCEGSPMVSVVTPRSAGGGAAPGVSTPGGSGGLAGTVGASAIALTSSASVTTTHSGVLVTGGSSGQFSSRFDRPDRSAVSSTGTGGRVNLYLASTSATEESKRQGNLTGSVSTLTGTTTTDHSIHSTLHAAVGGGGTHVANASSHNISFAEPTSPGAQATSTSTAAAQLLCSASTATTTTAAVNPGGASVQAGHSSATSTGSSHMATPGLTAATAVPTPLSLARRGTLSLLSDVHMELPQRQRSLSSSATATTTTATDGFFVPAPNAVLSPLRDAALTGAVGPTLPPLSTSLSVSATAASASPTFRSSNAPTTVTTGNDAGEVVEMVASVHERRNSFDPLSISAYPAELAEFEIHGSLFSPSGTAVSTSTLATATTPTYYPNNNSSSNVTQLADTAVPFSPTDLGYVTSTTATATPTPCATPSPSVGTVHGVLAPLRSIGSVPGPSFFTTPSPMTTAFVSAGAGALESTSMSMGADWNTLARPRSGSHGMVSSRHTTSSTTHSGSGGGDGLGAGSASLTSSSLIPLDAIAAGADTAAALAGALRAVISTATDTATNAPMTYTASEVTQTAANSATTPSYTSAYHDWTDATTTVSHRLDRHHQSSHDPLDQPEPSHSEAREIGASQEDASTMTTARTMIRLHASAGSHTTSDAAVPHPIPHPDALAHAASAASATDLMTVHGNTQNRGVPHDQRGDGPTRSSATSLSSPPHVAVHTSDMPQSPTRDAHTAASSPSTAPTLSMHEVTLATGAEMLSNTAASETAPDSRAPTAAVDSASAEATRTAVRSPTCVLLSAVQSRPLSPLTHARDRHTSLTLSTSSANPSQSPALPLAASDSPLCQAHSHRSGDGVGEPRASHTLSDQRLSLSSPSAPPSLALLPAGTGDPKSSTVSKETTTGGTARDAITVSASVLSTSGGVHSSTDRLCAARLLSVTEELSSSQDTHNTPSPQTQTHSREPLLSLPPVRLPCEPCEPRRDSDGKAETKSPRRTPTPRAESTDAGRVASPVSPRLTGSAPQTKASEKPSLCDEDGRTSQTDAFPEIPSPKLSPRVYTLLTPFPSGFSPQRARTLTPPSSARANPVAIATPLISQSDARVANASRASGAATTAAPHTAATPTPTGPFLSVSATSVSAPVAVPHAAAGHNSSAARSDATPEPVPGCPTLEAERRAEFFRRARPPPHSMASQVRDSPTPATGTTVPSRDRLLSLPATVKGPEENRDDADEGCRVPHEGGLEAVSGGSGVLDEVDASNVATRRAGETAESTASSMPVRSPHTSPHLSTAAAPRESRTNVAEAPTRTLVPTNPSPSSSAVRSPTEKAAHTHTMQTVTPTTAVAGPSSAADAVTPPKREGDDGAARVADDDGHRCRDASSQATAQSEVPSAQQNRTHQHHMSEHGAGAAGHVAVPATPPDAIDAVHSAAHAKLCGSAGAHRHDRYGGEAAPSTTGVASLEALRQSLDSTSAINGSSAATTANTANHSSGDSNGEKINNSPVVTLRLTRASLNALSQLGPSPISIKDRIHESLKGMSVLCADGDGDPLAIPSGPGTSADLREDWKSSQEHAPVHDTEPEKSDRQSHRTTSAGRAMASNVSRHTVDRTRTSSHSITSARQDVSLKAHTESSPPPARKDEAEEHGGTAEPGPSSHRSTTATFPSVDVSMPTAEARVDNDAHAPISTHAMPATSSLTQAAAAMMAKVRSRTGAGSAPRADDHAAVVRAVTPRSVDKASWPTALTKSTMTMTTTNTRSMSAPSSPLCTHSPPRVQPLTSKAATGADTEPRALSRTTGAAPSATRTLAQTDVAVPATSTLSAHTSPVMTSPTTTTTAGSTALPVPSPLPSSAQQSRVVSLVGTEARDGQSTPSRPAVSPATTAPTAPTPAVTPATTAAASAAALPNSSVEIVAVLGNTLGATVSRAGETTMGTLSTLTASNLTNTHLNLTDTYSLQSTNPTTVSATSYSTSLSRVLTELGRTSGSTQSPCDHLTASLRLPEVESSMNAHTPAPLIHTAVGGGGVVGGGTDVMTTNMALGGDRGAGASGDVGSLRRPPRESSPTHLFKTHAGVDLGENSGPQTKPKSSRPSLGTSFAGNNDEDEDEEEMINETLVRTYGLGQVHEAMAAIMEASNRRRQGGDGFSPTQGVHRYQDDGSGSDDDADSLRSRLLSVQASPASPALPARLTPPNPLTVGSGQSPTLISADDIFANVDVSTHKPPDTQSLSPAPEPRSSSGLRSLAKSYQNDNVSGDGDGATTTTSAPAGAHCDGSVPRGQRRDLSDSPTPPLTKTQRMQRLAHRDAVETSDADSASIGSGHRCALPALCVPLLPTSRRLAGAGTRDQDRPGEAVSARSGSETEEEEESGTIRVLPSNTTDQSMSSLGGGRGSAMTPINHIAFGYGTLVSLDALTHGSATPTLSVPRTSSAALASSASSAFAGASLTCIASASVNRPSPGLDDSVNVDAPVLPPAPSAPLRHSPHPTRALASRTGAGPNTSSPAPAPPPQSPTATVSAAGGHPPIAGVPRSPTASTEDSAAVVVLRSSPASVTTAAMATGASALLAPATSASNTQHDSSSATIVIRSGSTQGRSQRLSMNSSFSFVGNSHEAKSSSAGRSSTTPTPGGAGVMSDARATMGTNTNSFASARVCVSSPGAASATDLATPTSQEELVAVTTLLAVPHGDGHHNTDTPILAGSAGALITAAPLPSPLSSLGAACVPLHGSPVRAADEADPQLPHSPCSAPPARRRHTVAPPPLQFLASKAEQELAKEQAVRAARHAEAEAAQTRGLSSSVSSPRLQADQARSGPHRTDRSASLSPLPARLTARDCEGPLDDRSDAEDEPRTIQNPRYTRTTQTSNTTTDTTSTAALPSSISRHGGAERTGSEESPVAPGQERRRDGTTQGRGRRPSPSALVLTTSTSHETHPSADADVNSETLVDSPGSQPSQRPAPPNVTAPHASAGAEIANRQRDANMAMTKHQKTTPASSADTRRAAHTNTVRSTERDDTRRAKASVRSARSWRSADERLAQEVAGDKADFAAAGEAGATHERGDAASEDVGDNVDQEGEELVFISVTVSPMSMETQRTPHPSFSTATINAPGGGGSSTGGGNVPFLGLRTVSSASLSSHGSPIPVKAARPASPSRAMDAVAGAADFGSTLSEIHGRARRSSVTATNEPLLHDTEASSTSGQGDQSSHALTGPLPEYRCRTVNDQREPQTHHDATAATTPTATDDVAFQDMSESTSMSTSSPKMTQKARDAQPRLPPSAHAPSSTVTLDDTAITLWGEHTLPSPTHSTLVAIYPTSTENSRATPTAAGMRHRSVDDASMTATTTTATTTAAISTYTHYGTGTSTRTTYTRTTARSSDAPTLSVRAPTITVSSESSSMGTETGAASRVFGTNSTSGGGVGRHGYSRGGDDGSSGSSAAGPSAHAVGFGASERRVGSLVCNAANAAPFLTALIDVAGGHQALVPALIYSESPVAAGRAMPTTTRTPPPNDATTTTTTTTSGPPCAHAVEDVSSSNAFDTPPRHSLHGSHRTSASEPLTRRSHEALHVTASGDDRETSLSVLVSATTTLSVAANSTSVVTSHSPPRIAVALGVEDASRARTSPLLAPATLSPLPDFRHTNEAAAPPPAGLGRPMVEVIDSLDASSAPLALTSSTSSTTSVTATTTANSSTTIPYPLAERMRAQWHTVAPAMDAAMVTFDTPNSSLHSGPLPAGGFARRASVNPMMSMTGTTTTTLHTNNSYSTLAPRSEDDVPDHGSVRRAEEEGHPPPPGAGVESAAHTHAPVETAAPADEGDAHSSATPSTSRDGASSLFSSTAAVCSSVRSSSALAADSTAPLKAAWSSGLLSTATVTPTPVSSSTRTSRSRASEDRDGLAPGKGKDTEADLTGASLLGTLSSRTRRTASPTTTVPPTAAVGASPSSSSSAPAPAPVPDAAHTSTSTLTRPTATTTAGVRALADTTETTPMIPTSAHVTPLYYTVLREHVHSPQSRVSDFSHRPPSSTSPSTQADSAARSRVLNTNLALRRMGSQQKHQSSYFP